MGCSHIPDFDSASSSADDKPFAASKSQSTGKISVNFPTINWLCNKFDKLNLILVEGYPSKLFDAGGVELNKLTFWYNELARLHSSYSWIARSSGLQATPPVSRLISQESLRKWEREW